MDAEPSAKACSGATRPAQYGSYGGGGGGGSVAGGGGGSPIDVLVSFACPRISPAGFLVVWTLTYAVPFRIASATALVTFAVPVWPLRHGPQSARMTPPAMPTRPRWTCAATAGLLSLRYVSFHEMERTSRPS